MPETNRDKFLQSWENFLNDDHELKGRIVPFKGFFGGPSPTPGPGPYSRPTPAYDPTGWANAKGYSAPKVDGRDLIELALTPGGFICTISLRKGKFGISKRSAKKPFLSVKMPNDLWRETVQGKHKIIWALSDKRVTVKNESGISMSDWLTILEVLATSQELLEFEPKLWESA